MRNVFVLEDDPKLVESIKEALFSIDPALKVHYYTELKEFAAFVQLVMRDGAAALGEGTLNLVISKVEFLGVEQLGLIRKTRDLFIKKGLCTAEDPTAWVLTAFENPDFPLSDLGDKILSNVIFKPFDRLILEQHLQYAIDGRHPPSRSAVALLKTSSIIEMLKEIEIECLSDIGMASRSLRPIEVGAVAKYYGVIFKTASQKSAIGYCYKCEPHPLHPSEFLVWTRFFALDPTQISQLRKKVRDKSLLRNEKSWVLTPPPQSDLTFVSLDPEEKESGGLVNHLENRFENAKVISFNSLQDLLFELEPEEQLKKFNPEKPTPAANEIILNFDKPLRYFMGAEATDDSNLLFGQKIKELKTKENWILASMDEPTRKKFRVWLEGKAEGSFKAALRFSENTYFIKVSGVRTVDRVLQFTVTGLDKPEILAFLQAESKLGSAVHGLIVSNRSVSIEGLEVWNLIKQKIADRCKLTPMMILLSKQNYTDEDERKLASVFTALFFKPVDKVYFNHVISHLFPNLRLQGEVVTIEAVNLIEPLKVATPVKVNELSEAGLVLEYYRQLSVGTFREFVLWQPYEVGAPELLASNNFVEKIEGSKPEAYKNHFVFFGMSDYFLKHIRLWIRDNYVLSKQEK